MPIITNIKTSIAYKIILVLIALYGIFINTRNSPQMFLYYTILSNLLCLGYFIYNIIRTLGHKAINTNSKGAVTLAITVTMLIYWFILAPHGFVMNSATAFIGNLCVHLIVPLMVILDWLLFDKKGQFNKLAPIAWLAIPLIYYMFTVIAANFKIVYAEGGHYPYFFIDSNVLGWLKVSLNVIGLTLFFLVLGYVFYFTDSKLGQSQHNKLAND